MCVEFQLSSSSHFGDIRGPKFTLWDAVSCETCNQSSYNADIGNNITMACSIQFFCCCPYNTVALPCQYVTVV